MTCTADSPRQPGAGPACEWDMTVFELAIFLSAYRASQPAGVDTLCERLGGWFECAVAPPEVSVAADKMIARGWLAIADDRFLPVECGRRAARPLVNGIIRMLDQGTRLIDVALMMSVLRLAKEELDNGARHS